MNIQKLFLLFITISFALASCNKENEETTNNETNTSSNNYCVCIPDSTIFPYIFDENNFWIFQSDSLENDTVILTEITYNSEGLPPAGPSQGPSGVMYLYNVKYHSSKYGEHEEQMFKHYISLDRDFGPFLLITSKEIGESYSGGTIINVFDTLTVNNNLFHNVTLMRTFDPQYFSNNNYHSILLYYADSIGIIKKEIFQNDSIKTTWNLIEYNVNVLDSAERDALKPTYN